MSLPYAGGLNLPQESSIAAAIVERLMALHQDAGLFLRCVAEIPVMPTRIKDKASWDALLAVMNTRAPAALVSIDSARTDPGEMSVERTHWMRTYDVTIAVFSNHAHDLILGRLDPDAASLVDERKDPGLRAACERIDQLLLGYPLGIPCVGELEPGRQGMQTVYAGALGTLREMNYTVDGEIRRVAPTVGAFVERIHTTFDEPGLVLEMETEVTS